MSTPLGCRPLLPSMPVPAGCSGSSPCVYPHSAIGLSPICVSSEFVIVVLRLYLRPPIMMMPRKSDGCDNCCAGYPAMNTPLPSRYLNTQLSKVTLAVPDRYTAPLSAYCGDCRPQSPPPGMP